MIDQNKTPSQQITPSSAFFAVTPDDLEDLPLFPKGIYVSVTGDLVLMNSDEQTVDFGEVPAGTVIPVRARRVMEATTASVVALA